MDHILTSNSVNHSTQVCPECQASIPVHAGFVVWCAECDWNVHPSEDSRPRNWLESFYERLGQRLSAGLFQELQQQPELKLRFTLAKGIALVIATLIHFVTVGFLGLGLVLVINGWPHVITVFLGMVCFGVAWVVRPRIPKRPKQVLTRNQAPALFQVVDRIGAALNAKPIDGIVILPDFNAAYGQAGIPLRRYLYIGLPLFTILSKPEKIGILGHELAHGINGDPVRRMYVSTALNSLLNWAYLLRPEHILAPSDGSLIGVIVSIGMVPFNLWLRLVAKCLVWSAFGLLKLVYHDSQRAEYLADSIAAKASGSNDFLAALEKLYVYGTITNEIRRFALNKRNDDIFEAFQTAIHAIPTTEIERLRRVNLTELARIDTTHPPTSYRVAMLNTFPVHQPLVELSDAEMQAFDQALKEHREKIQGDLIQNYKESLYYG